MRWLCDETDDQPMRSDFTAPVSMYIYSVVYIGHLDLICKKERTENVFFKGIMNSDLEEFVLQCQSRERAGRRQPPVRRVLRVGSHRRVGVRVGRGRPRHFPPQGRAQLRLHRRRGRLARRRRPVCPLLVGTIVLCGIQPVLSGEPGFYSYLGLFLDSER